MVASRVPVDQVKQGKQINPDKVDEVPIEAGDFDRRLKILETGDAAAS